MRHQHSERRQPAQHHCIRRQHHGADAGDQSGQCPRRGLRAPSCDAGNPKPFQRGQVRDPLQRRQPVRADHPRAVHRVEARRQAGPRQPVLAQRSAAAVHDRRSTTPRWARSPAGGAVCCDAMSSQLPPTVTPISMSFSGSQTFGNGVSVRSLSLPTGGNFGFSGDGGSATQQWRARRRARRSSRCPTRTRSWAPRSRR